MLQADSTQLRWMAHLFSAAADEIRRKATAVERVSDDVTGGTNGWIGEAAQGFVQRAEFLANEVRESVKDFATISDALQTLAHRVELIQGKQQHLQNLQHQRSHLHFGLDLQVDAEIARLDGQIWALEAEITADRLYADMAAATAFRGVQIREAIEEIWESVKQAAPGVLAKINDELEDIKDTAIEGVKEVAKDVGDFAEGFSATYLQNASMGLADPLHEDNPEARSDWYKAGRLAGDVTATVQGAAEMFIGGEAVVAGGAEAIVASPTVVLSAVGVGAAVAGGTAVAHGWTTFNEATGKLKGDWSLFKKERSELSNEQLASKPKNSPDPEKWKSKGGSITIDENGNWTYHDWEGNSVTYPGGYPDFKSSGMVKQEVQIGEFENYAKDFNKADELAPNGPIDRDVSTWHHHEDGTTMQEVDRILHGRYTHRGGMSLRKKGGK